MPSLRDLRRRIKSVKNTEKITKAQQLVAASKMRRAQERMQASRPYAEEITGIMVELMRRSPEYEHPYLQKREVKGRSLIVVTADRGSVGALNSNNVRLALGEINAGIDTAVVTIGRKGRDSIKRLKKNLIAEVSGYGDAPTLGTILPAIRVALEHYESGESDQLDLVYSRFISAGRQVATLKRLLPVAVPEDVPRITTDFEYEPEPKVVLDALLPRYIESAVYQAVLENIASEQAARVIAMKNASDNAADLIEDLSLTANKVRQATITTELMEIVGGVAAQEA